MSEFRDSTNEEDGNPPVLLEPFILQVVKHPETNQFGFVHQGVTGVSAHTILFSKSNWKVLIQKMIDILQDES
jgi:hypothetical protein